MYFNRLNIPYEYMNYVVGWDMYVHCDDDDDDDDGAGGGGGDDDGGGGGDGDGDGDGDDDDDDDAGGGGGGGGDDEVVRTLLDFFFFLMKCVIAPWAKTQSFRIRVVDSTRRFRRRCKIFCSAEASPCPMRTRFPSKFSTCNKGLVVDLAQWWGSTPGNFKVCQVCKTFQFNQCSFFKACTIHINVFRIFPSSRPRMEVIWPTFYSSRSGQQGHLHVSPNEIGSPILKGSHVSGVAKQRSIRKSAWKFSANKRYEALQMLAS